MEANEEWIEAQTWLLKAIQATVSTAQREGRSREYAKGFLEGLILGLGSLPLTATSARTFFEVAWPDE